MKPETKRTLMATLGLGFVMLPFTVYPALLFGKYLVPIIVSMIGIHYTTIFYVKSFAKGGKQ